MVATRFLLLCVAVLALPAIATAQTPPRPSELRVLVDPTSAADNYGLRLVWRDNSQNETGFEISDGETSRLVGAQTTFYRWGTMTPGEYKCFKVRSYNDTGSSTWEPNVDPWYRCGTTSKGTSLHFDQVNTTGYAGYGAKGKEFIHAAGTWWVPRVECPLLQLQETRAAPWVGLTGKDLSDKNTFLIQVGTVSHCQLGYVYHKAFWQVYRKAPGGTTPQVLFDVKENDLISAYVSYDQSDGMFYISITDVSQGITQPRVRLDVPGLAGATGENSRSRTLCIVESADGGLAQFNTPIEWWGCITGSNQVNRSLWPDKFDMNKECVPPSDPDCKTKKDIAPKAEVSHLDVPNDAFSVKWLRQ